MSLVALANALLDEPMPRRFHAEPMVRAADLLLQERIPRDVGPHRHVLRARNIERTEHRALSILVGVGIVEHVDQHRDAQSI